RPYADPVEIVTAPIPAQSPFIPIDSKIVVGPWPRRPRTRSRSCCCPASSTGYESGVTRRPTRSTGCSSEGGPPSPATTTERGSPVEEEGGRGDRARDRNAGAMACGPSGAPRGREGADAAQRRPRPPAASVALGPGREGVRLRDARGRHDAGGALRRALA